MTTIPSNIHPDYISEVSQDKLALEFATAADGMFSITGYANISKRRGQYLFIL